MLEALIFAAGIATASPARQEKVAAAPAAELLEFIADWPEAEAHQFLDAPNDAATPLPSLDRTSTGRITRKPVHAR
jgi:hypothetical protein